MYLCVMPYSIFFFFSSSVSHRHLHSFPTRRSSDLLYAARQRRRVAGLAARDPGGRRTKCRQIRAAAARICRHFVRDRKSTRLNSSHTVISYAVFCLKKKKKKNKVRDK